jgi:hypothetical protein
VKHRHKRQAWRDGISGTLAVKAKPQSRRWRVAEQKSGAAARRRLGGPARRQDAVISALAPESEDLHRNPLRLANSPALAQFPEGFRNFT